MLLVSNATAYATRFTGRAPSCDKQGAGDLSRHGTSVRVPATFIITFRLKFMMETRVTTFDSRSWGFAHRSKLSKGNRVLLSFDRTITTCRDRENVFCTRLTAAPSVPLTWRSRAFRIERQVASFASRFAWIPVYS